MTASNIAKDRPRRHFAECRASGGRRRSTKLKPTFPQRTQKCSAAYGPSWTLFLAYRSLTWPSQPASNFDCVKASISHAEITPKEIEPRPHERIGWRALTRYTMDTFKERGRTQIEEVRERRKASADAPGNPVSSHARSVPGPASLGSDSTATSVPMAHGSNAEERDHRFRWTTTSSYDTSVSETSTIHCISAAVKSF